MTTQIHIAPQASSDAKKIEFPAVFQHRECSELFVLFVSRTRGHRITSDGIRKAETLAPADYKPVWEPFYGTITITVNP